MKKRKRISLLAMLALLCVFFVSCDLLEDSPPGKDTPRESEKEPPPEKMYYTLRLVDDDSEGVGSNRALTNELAQASHDFFEVVFYYDDTRIARTTWNIGETPELRGVYGNGDGHTSVNYSAVSTGTSGNTPAAVLFVGTKEDNTLLAVGRLTNANGDGNAYTVSPNTTEVTFEVTALKSGVGFTNSSFTTNYTSGGGTFANNVLNNVFIHYVDKNKFFPLYPLNRSDGSNLTIPSRPAPTSRAQTLGQYTFDIVTPDGYSGPAFNDYAAGIVLSGKWNCEVRNPRYIITDGLYQYSSIFVQDIREGSADLADEYKLAVMNNNKTADGAFQNPVTFTFRTTTTAPPPPPGSVTVTSPDGSIFALAFEIFVYNLTPLNTTLDNSPPVKWRISTGTGTKWLDLDDGNGGEGGAILLGSGDITTWLTPYNWQ